MENNAIIIQNIQPQELYLEIRRIVQETIKEHSEGLDKAEYLTKRETASLLRISLPTLSRLAKTGEIPCRRIGRRILFDTHEVQDFMRNDMDLINNSKYHRR